MSVINYVSVDRIFSKINRDLKGTEIPEDDVIEWIGEALDFLKVPQKLVMKTDKKECQSNLPHILNIGN